jgi:putative hydrolase of the HAD superfamily
MRRGLILDLDDTLYPHASFAHSGFAAVAKHVAATRGVELDAAFGLLCRASAIPEGRPFQVLCDRYALGPDAVSALVDVYRAHEPTLWLHHDAIATLRGLRRDGWQMAVVTNGLPPVQARKVSALSVADYVDHVVYAEEWAPEGKPAAAPFLEALRLLDASPEHCVCVGDDPLRDISGARGVGMHTIRIVRPNRAPLPGMDADVLIDNLSELRTVAASLVPMMRLHAA